jgi:hypothetical protein
VPVVFSVLCLYLVPVLFLFCFGLVYVGGGLVQSWRHRSRSSSGKDGREAA